MHIKLRKNYQPNVLQEDTKILSNFTQLQESGLKLRQSYKFPTSNLNQLHPFRKDLMIGQRNYHSVPSQSLDTLCHVVILKRRAC